MAIVWTERIGSATVTLRDDDCQCGEEEMAERRRKLNGAIASILADPIARENLRRINRERYGEE